MLTFCFQALRDGQPVDQLAWMTAPVVAGVRLIMNTPAAVIVILVTILAYIGIRESKKSANFMVGLKLVVLTFVGGKPGVLVCEGPVTRDGQVT